MNAVISTSVARPRGVERVISGQFVMDGAGVKINRVLTQTLQRRLDPFLMLDAFGSDKAGDYIAGFPEHPHRGFETVTYMLKGRMRHRDSAGNEGLITDGGVQWMTAGRGVIHSEMPEQNEGLMEGFQLWLNLPRQGQAARPVVPRHPERRGAALYPRSGVTVQVIAGSAHGVAGAVQREGTEPLYLDIELPAGAELRAADARRAQRLLLCVPRRSGHRGQGVPQTRMAILDNAEGADGVASRRSSRRV